MTVYSRRLMLVAAGICLFLLGTAVVYAGCGTCAGCTQAAAKAQPTKARSDTPTPELSTAALATLVRAKAPAVILDARTAKWDDGQRIPGAQHLTYEASAADVSALLPRKDTLIVTYCGSQKCPLSHKLAHRLQSLGYTNVLEYRDGIKGWRAAGNRTVSASEGAHTKRARSTTNR